MTIVTIQEPNAGEIASESTTEIIVSLSYGPCPICNHTSGEGECEGCKPQGILCLPCKYRGGIPA